MENETVSKSKNKLLAAISYIWILCLVGVLCAKEDEFVRYHANQGLVLFIVNIAANVVCYILEFIPIAGAIASWIIDIALIVFAVIGIVNVVQGEMKPLPLIGGVKIIK